MGKSAKKKKTKKGSQPKKQREIQQEAKPPVPSPKATGPPFSIDIDDSGKGEDCSIKLYPNIAANYNDIEFTVKIRKNPLTGKPQYDIHYINLKEKPGDVTYTPNDLKPFPVLDLDTRETLTVLPEKTAGRPPFTFADPKTKVEKTIGPPKFIHFDLASGKRYLLDLTKFKDGEFTFKDPETGEGIAVDITQRRDPLTGHLQDARGSKKIYVGQYKNGEVYILKDPETDEIEVLNCDGRLADNYHAGYDNTTDVTTIVDDNGDLLTTLDGKHPIATLPDYAEDLANTGQDMDGNARALDYPEFGDILTYDESGHVNVDQAAKAKQVRFTGDKGPMSPKTRAKPLGLSPPGYPPNETKLNQEMYFENLKLEEGYVILNQVRKMDSSTKANVLDALIQVIEFEKDFVNYALSAKIREERFFIQNHLKAKEVRQNRFIINLLTPDYNKNEIKEKVVRQLNKENELIFQKLNGKIAMENNLLIESIKKEMSDNRDTLVKKSNKKCYQSLKRIIYRYLSEKLEQEVKQIKQEVAFNLAREREILLDEINKKLIGT